MTPRGRLSIPYDRFVELWETLVTEGRARASINAVQNSLGGDKSTIKAYQERYAREQVAKELSMLKSIQLTDAVQKAIAAIKVKELELVEHENQQLKNRLDGVLADLAQSEAAYSALTRAFEDAKIDWDARQQKAQRDLAIAESRVSDAEKREQQLGEQYQALSEQVNQYRPRKLRWQKKRWSCCGSGGRRVREHGGNGSVKVQACWLVTLE